eukprot:6229580-Pyramimonas_sp.AAC.1
MNTRHLPPCFLIRYWTGLDCTDLSHPGQHRSSLELRLMATMAANVSMSVARLTSRHANTSDVRRTHSAVRYSRPAPSTVRCGATGDHDAHNADGAVIALETRSQRRQLMIAAATSLSLAKINPVFKALASDDVGTFTEPLLAYQFSYPTTDAAGTPLKWFAPRAAERYSSAAPLSADARQRIVYELINFDGATPLTLSVSVGPIPPQLIDTPSDKWTPNQLAEAILEEKSTGRVTNGQRVAMSSLEEATFVERDGTKYCLFEHVSQGSPNASEVYSKETYRHSLAVTAVRGDYLYTLNVAAPEKRWASVAAGFAETQQSFTLNNPTKAFVPPEKDPWRFW